MWKQCLFSLRQLLNLYAICCAKLLIPSEVTWILKLLIFFFSFPSSAPPTVRIIHSGHACNVEEERHTERVYTIREGETLELTCLVTGHPRPQVRNVAFIDEVGRTQLHKGITGQDANLTPVCLLPDCFLCPSSSSAAFPLIPYWCHWVAYHVPLH